MLKGFKSLNFILNRYWSNTGSNNHLVLMSRSLLSCNYIFKLEVGGKDRNMHQQKYLIDIIMILEGKNNLKMCTQKILKYVFGWHNYWKGNFKIQPEPVNRHIIFFLFCLKWFQKVYIYTRGWMTELFYWRKKNYLKTAHTKY